MAWNTAQSFKLFAEEWDFRHVTSSPLFPQSNGFIKRAIQTVKKSVKKSFKKAHDGNEDPYLTLLILNKTPGSDGVSPAMRLFNHKPRSMLLSLNSSHALTSPKTVAKGIKESYNQHAKNLPDIITGTVVCMRVPGERQWDEIGKVVAKCQEPRTYCILNSKGNIVRRNRRHLLPCKDKFHIQIDHTELPGSTQKRSNLKTLRFHLNLLLASHRNQVL